MKLADKAQHTGSGPQATAAGVAVNARTVRAKIILSLTWYELKIMPIGISTDGCSFCIHLRLGINCPSLSTCSRVTGGKEGAFLDHTLYTICKMGIKIEPSFSSGCTAQ